MNSKNGQTIQTSISERFINDLIEERLTQFGFWQGRKFDVSSAVKLGKYDPEQKCFEMTVSEDNRKEKYFSDDLDQIVLENIVQIKHANTKTQKP
jgi:uncharacterized protein YkuJ